MSKPSQPTLKPSQAHGLSVGSKIIFGLWAGIFVKQKRERIRPDILKVPCLSSTIKGNSGRAYRAYRAYRASGRSKSLSSAGSSGESSRKSRVFWRHGTWRHETR